MAERSRRFHGERIYGQSVPLADLERPQSDRADRHRLDTAVARLSRGCWRTLRKRGLRSLCTRLGRSTGGGGGTCQPCPLHERSDPFHHRARGVCRRRAARAHTHAAQRSAVPSRSGAPRGSRRRRPRRRDNPDRGVRQRRNGEHGHGGSIGGDGRLLRGGRHMAACGCGLRRIRGRDGAWSASACRNWKSRLHQSRRAQVVLPALRGGLPAGEGRADARACVRSAARRHPGLDWGANHPNITDRGLQLTVRRGR